MPKVTIKSVWPDQRNPKDSDKYRIGFKDTTGTSYGVKPNAPDWSQEERDAINALKPGDVVELTAIPRNWEFQGKSGVTNDVTALKVVGHDDQPKGGFGGGGFKGKSPEQSKLDNHFMAWENATTNSSNIGIAFIEKGQISPKEAAEFIQDLTKVLALNTIKGAES